MFYTIVFLKIRTENMAMDFFLFLHIIRYMIFILQLQLFHIN